MDEDKDKIAELAHHSISKLLGISEPELCPECGSTQWFRNVEHITTYKDFSDGYKEYRGGEYMCTTWACDDCDHCDD